MFKTVKKKKILIVDDEESFTHVVKLNLEATGSYEVCVENNSLAAIDTARKFRPDFIFLDIIMTGKEGSEIANELVGDSVLQSTPYAFLTATVTPEEVNTFRGTIGGHSFLAKPVDTQQMIQCIENRTKR